jgi:hypothetical protein
MTFLSPLLAAPQIRAWELSNQWVFGMLAPLQESDIGVVCVPGHVVHIHGVVSLTTQTAVLGAAIEKNCAHGIMHPIAAGPYEAYERVQLWTDRALLPVLALVWGLMRAGLGLSVAPDLTQANGLGLGLPVGYQLYLLFSLPLLVLFGSVSSRTSYYMLGLLQAKQLIAKCFLSSVQSFPVVASQVTSSSKSKSSGKSRVRERSKSRPRR